MSSKQDLRQQLAALTAQHLESNPEGVTLYAAERKPDRKPWRKRPSLLDQAFAQELEKAEREQSEKPPI